MSLLFGRVMGEIIYGGQEQKMAEVGERTPWMDFESLGFMVYPCLFAEKGLSMLAVAIFINKILSGSSLSHNIHLGQTFFKIKNQTTIKSFLKYQCTCLVSFKNKTDVYKRHVIL